MISPGIKGKSCRHHEDLCASQRQQAEKFRETQIITNRQAKRNFINFGGYNIVARRDTLRFVVLLAIRQAYIKEMYFTIAGNNFAIVVDEHRGVVELATH